ncbi:MAG: transporter permease [Bacteroidota bacterium]|jgi:phospholipid/cholesterol/gamma-HCH transport system permease protein|nr:transporter permease [Bacteroidota bacterium]
MKSTAVRLFLVETGNLYRFAVRFFREGFKPHYEISEFIRQCFYIGNRTLPLVAITGFIIGLVITIQSHPSMEAFGAESWLPSVVSVSLVREIVPVITALICAGKIGSGIGAELGSMKVTEQIDAMEVSGTNPFKYLVVTRVFAAMLMLPLLIILSDTIALYGAYLGVNMKQVVSFHLFTNQIFEKLTFGDVLPSIAKAVFFGFAIGLIGCYKGYHTKNGTQGVGMAANSAVVAAIFVVFIIDLVAAQIADIFHIT